MKARHQVSFSRIRRQHLDVVRNKPRSLQPGRHRLCGRGVVACRVGGVDLDELLVDVERQLLRPGIERRSGGGGRCSDEKGEDQEPFHGGGL